MQPYDGKSVRIGMKVRRMLAGKVPMELMVTDLNDTLVTCGWWTFDRTTGVEIDEELGWGLTITGSVLTEMEDAE